MSRAVLPTSGIRVESDAATQPRAASWESADSLKICFISETMISGVGRHIADAICALSERGHEIHFLYSPIRLDAQLLAIVKERPNVRCEAVPMPRAIGWKDFSAFNRIKKYVRANGPFDVIHGHSSKGGGYARLLKFFGVRPVVYTPHAFVTFSPVIKGFKRAVYRSIETVLGRMTDRVICGSLVESEHALELGIPGDRLAVIANGVSAVVAPPRAIVRQRLGLAENQIAVGFVGRMDDQKAPERLIAAARLLLPELPNLTFVMIGSGPKRQYLEAGLHRTGFGHRVRWLGQVHSRHYLPAFDILAMPSLYEGFAYVPIEALHAGLPIVGTPVGGMRETVEPGVNGFIVPHDDAHELAEAIRILATDHALRRAMGEASRNRADKFSIARMIDAIEDVYRKVRVAPLPSSEAPSAAPASSPETSTAALQPSPLTSELGTV